MEFAGNWFYGKMELQESKEGNVPNGEVCIDIGAYCEVGSSQAIFKKVLEFLLEIIQMENIDNSSILNYFENTANYKIGI